jgi:SPP1 gp7 family putative phage head morphogenesis protein
MNTILVNAVPHDEAIAFIKDKPAVTVDVFKRLLPEVQARAFTITGIESADVLSAVRDRIATLPAGADWDKVKRQIVNDISPFLATSDDPDEARRQQQGAEARAELLMRIHGFQAYAAANYRNLDAQRDIFTHWRYQSMEDHKVRPTHAALDGVVLPNESEFWSTHFPPWEWGCRCQVVGLMQPDVNDIKAAEADKAPELRDVLDGPARKRLEVDGLINRGPSKQYNVQSAAERKDPNGFHWSPGELRLDLAMLKDRYAHDPEMFAQFEAWAKKKTLPQLNQTVWQWLNREPVGTPAKPAVEVTPKKVAAGSKPASVSELLKQIGITDLKTATITPDQAAQIQAALVEAKPVKVTDIIGAVKGNAAYPVKKVRSMAQQYLDMLPVDLAKALPQPTISVKAINGALGEYDFKTHAINISIANTSESEFRRVLWHEMTHWVHMNGPQEYRDSIATLFSERTKGFTEPVTTLHATENNLYGYGTTGMEDDLADINGNTYAGRIYRFEAAKPGGLEIPTRHMEKLSSSPAALSAYLNHQSKLTQTYAWRQVFFTALEIFFL